MSLSDKIDICTSKERAELKSLWAADVKDFIKELKEKYRYRRINIMGTTIIRDIDKLAGEKLI